MTIFCENCDKKVEEQDIFQEEFCSEECFREYIMAIHEVLSEQVN